MADYSSLTRKSAPDFNNSSALGSFNPNMRNPNIRHNPNKPPRPGAAAAKDGGQNAPKLKVSASWTPPDRSNHPSQVSSHQVKPSFDTAPPSQASSGQNYAAAGGQSWQNTNANQNFSQIPTDNFASGQNQNQSQNQNQTGNKSHSSGFGDAFGGQNYENNGPNYTNMRGEYNKNSGYRGRGNRGGSQNYGRTFDSKGRANTGFRETGSGDFMGNGGFNSSSRGSRNAAKGENMPVSRGGYHRNMARNEEESYRNEKNYDQNLPDYNIEDDLFRPKIFSQKQKDFMERKRAGTKTAAQQALAKVKARKMMWRSQRKEVLEKEAEKAKEAEMAGAKELFPDLMEQKTDESRDFQTAPGQQPENSEATEESADAPYYGDAPVEKEPEQPIDEDDDEAWMKANAGTDEQLAEKERQKKEKPAADKTLDIDYERTNKFYHKKASLNPFGGNMGEKFVAKVDDELIARIEAEEEAKRNWAAKQAAKQEDDKKNIKFGVRVAPRGGFGGARGGRRPTFTLSDPSVKKNEAVLSTQKLVLKNQEKKYEDSTYIGITPYKPPEVLKKEAEEKAKIAENSRENKVYKDLHEQNKERRIVNTALAQPTIISNTSDYYNQAVTSLGDTKRQAKFAKLMGMNRKRAPNPESSEDSAPLRRTFDPKTVNQDLENQFNTLRGGKTFFDN